MSGEHPPSSRDAGLRYDFLGTIARGGMAEVLLARASGMQGFEKLLAVKRILPHLAKNEEFVAMFLDEARIAATLNHPNIVQLHEIGSREQEYFFTMEFLHGEDVRHITNAAACRGQAVPVEHTLAIILGVCSALHYAHEKVDLDGAALGIVHRDVSPQNVIVTYDGGIKLVDFGIARAAHRLTETREGTLKGKVQYMSPEQCVERALDRRSDVFAVSVMLWELYCGERLYTGDSEFEILKQIVEYDAPSPRMVRAECPPELERIVVKGLARDREQRFPTAQALQADLEAFVRDHKIPVSSIGLATYMRELFHDKLASFRSAQARGRAGIGEYVRARRTLNGVLAASAASTRPAGARRHLSSGASSVADVAAVAPPPHERIRTRSLSFRLHPGRLRRSLPWLGATGALAIVVTSAVLGWRREQAPLSVQERPSLVMSDPTGETPTPSAPMTPPVATRRRIAVRSSPTQSKLTVDGLPLHQPWVDVADDGFDHRLRVSAPGYQTQVRSLQGVAEDEIVVVLRRASRARPQAGRKAGATGATPTVAAGAAREAHAAEPVPLEP